MTVVTPKVRSARLALLADTSRHTLPGQFPSTIIWVEVLELLSLSCISTTFSIFGRLYSPKIQHFWQTVQLQKLQALMPRPIQIHSAVVAGCAG